MLNHQVILLLQKLHSKKELSLKNFFESKNRVKSLKLYKIILRAKSDASLGKEVVFKKLFEKKYTVREDYLLRNEIRNLNQLLEEFMIEEQIVLERKNNPVFDKKMLLKAYLEVNDIESFIKEYPSTKELIIRNGSYIDLLELELDVLKFKPQITSDIQECVKIYPALIDEAELALRHVEELVNNKINWHKNHHNHYSTFINKKEKLYEIELVRDNDNAVTNPMAEYYHFSGRAMNASAQDKQELMDRAIQSLQQLSTSGRMIQHELITAYFTKARELSMAGRWQEADEVFDQAFCYQGLEKHPLKESFDVNYTTNLVKTKQFEKLINFAKDISVVHFRNKAAGNILILNRLIAFLYLKDIVQLKHYIPLELNIYTQQHDYYLRLIYSAYFYLTGEYELAEREIDNLLRRKESKDILTNFIPLFELYKKFYNTVNKKYHTVYSASDKEKLQVLYEEIEKEKEGFLVQLNMYHWLKLELLHLNLIQE